MNTELTGKDFEFLITPGDIMIKAEDFDQVMTPDSMEWKKVNKDDWDYYEVGPDEFSYSWEMPGIQMTFNDEMPFVKAKAIAGEIVSKLARYTGRNIELIVIETNELTAYD